VYGGGIAPLPFKRGATGSEVPFYNSIAGNFIVYQDRLETNLLQVFAYPENSEWFSIIFVIIFEVNIVHEQKQTHLVTISLFFKISIVLNSFTAPTALPLFRLPWQTAILTG